jgi:hypothetical protein
MSFEIEAIDHPRISCQILSGKKKFNQQKKQNIKTAEFNSPYLMKLCDSFGKVKIRSKQRR